ncbi:MAG: acyl carrier protein [Alphaproteobacteria bacterium]|nr:MAG: acyl carrier protein [Alphaproteobacteria bacterium]
MADITKKVTEVIAKTLEVDFDKVTAESHFVNDFNADSLQQIELVMALENEFGIQIPEEEANNIQTVQDAIDRVMKINTA